MRAIVVAAHFDGERIQLDTPVELPLNAKLLVTVLPEDDEEREDWLRLSGQGLERAYGQDEPEYGPESFKELNPKYAGR